MEVMPKGSRAIKWWIVVALWSVMLATLWVGPRVDPWFQAVELTAVAVLSVVAIIRLRPGQLDNLPRRVQRWITDESSKD
jgi:hypothetical protein